MSAFVNCGLLRTFARSAAQPKLDESETVSSPSIPKTKLTIREQRQRQKSLRKTYGVGEKVTFS